MALRPEPMQRMLIVASKGYQEKVIETLHGLRAAHFIDFHESREGDLAEFRLGAPLAGGAPASERLVRVRALLRNLGVEGAIAQKRISARDLEARLDAELDRAEADVSRAVETRETVRQQLQEGRDTEARLQPLTSLPLSLEDYRGYEHLTPFVGRADEAFAAELATVAPEHILAKGEGTLFALFVPTAQAPAVTDLLYRHGYAEIEVPEGKGAPDARVREIQAERAALEARLEKAEADLARLGGEHKDFLLAAEEHLGILVEKAEAPLSFAASDNAVIIDAWVPMSVAAKVEMAIHTATVGNVAVSRLETSGDVDHAHGHEHAHGAAPRSTPPTKYANSRATSRYEWFTELFATPRFNEIDPTAVFAFFFPLFFGFMVGDFGLGLLIALIGWLLVAKLPRVDGMKQLGTAFIAAGLVAAVFGGVVFRDALGIPFGFTHHMDEELEHLGLTVGCNGEVYKAVGETTWGCLLGGQTWHSEPIIGKVTDIPTMLLLSLAAAGVHLLLGLLFGIRNEWGHGGKHLAAKFGYLVVLVAFYPAAIALLNGAFWTAVTGLAPTIAFYAAGAGFVIGAIILGWAEGAPGVLEIPTIFSNILSYLRLGAVAIAKGAMAVAFNGLTLVPALVGAGTGDMVVLVLGSIGFIIAQVALLVLGILSGGIQSLRLNFVEMYTKFYKGGGARYAPFGRERHVTAPQTSAVPPGHGVATTAVVAAAATTLILNQP